MVLNKKEKEANFLETKSENFILALKNKILNDIFFIQERIWKWWKQFSIYKIRTMKLWSENNVPDEVLEWNKSKNDLRIIKSRAWMRKTWFDELPQLINILKWDMNIFWSRPMDKSTYEKLSENQKIRRNHYKPWIFWWYAFYNKWKRSANRTIRDNQDLYLRLRRIIEKKWILNIVKFNTFILIENIKAILNWVNR